jgi:hypothetical protein
MQRRRALVVAGTLTAALALAGGAMAANLGLLGSGTSPVGAATVQPAAAERPHRAARQRPRVRVIVQDVPVAGGGSTASGPTQYASAESAAPSVAPAPAPVVPAPATPVVDDDGPDDDHGDDAFDDGHDDDQPDDHGDDGVEEPDDD